MDHMGRCNLPPRTRTSEKKGEIAEGIEMLQTEHLGVPTLSFLNVSNGARDLRNRPQRESACHHELLFEKAAVATHAGPVPKLVPTRELEFLQYVCDVVFHRIRTHTLPARYFRIGEPVPHSLSHAPFRRGQEIVITRPTAGLICWHEAYGIKPGPYLPSPSVRTASGDTPEDIGGNRLKAMYGAPSATANHGKGPPTGPRTGSVFANPYSKATGKRFREAVHLRLESMEFM